MKHDFGGWATRANLKCTDNRVIAQGAFADQNGAKIPMVWQHKRDIPENVLGHAILEERGEGVYAKCFFNDSDTARDAKLLVQHQDIDSLSIYATDLIQKEKAVNVGGKVENLKYVMHGSIKEVSLVLNGANPGAYIDDISFAHDDEDSDEALIYTGLTLEHAASGGESEKTVADVFEEFTEEQKNVVYFLIGTALEEAQAGGGELEQNDNSGGQHFMNVFEQGQGDVTHGLTLSHSQIDAIFDDAVKFGSLKDSIMVHAGEYGIDNVEYLFPDAQNVLDSPEFISRRMDWVNGVLTGTKHTPFSRIKTMAADITADTARAKGYVKGNRKTEEVFNLLKRVTTPTTIYKKQKLDRDDILDIRDFNVVQWLWAEMRVMLDEEIARAILIGDGRPLEVGSEPNPDKIDEEHIRPIWKEDELFVERVLVSDPTNYKTLPDEVLRAGRKLKGTGTPTYYTTREAVTEMLLVRDDYDQRMYKTRAELAAAMGVADIVEVEPMEDQTREDSNYRYTLLGELVNLVDYNIGTDHGGEISRFEDFDIDYNQHKYLLEGRMSGALVKVKSAAILESRTAI